MQFETIPEEENALLEKPKTGLRRVIVAAAALSFALGAVAATAVGSTSITDASVCEGDDGIWCDAPP